MRCQAQHGKSGCRKHATSAVIVMMAKSAEGSNAGIFVSICPRVYKGYGTGEGYRYCKEYCGQLGVPKSWQCVMARPKAWTREDLMYSRTLVGLQKCWDIMLALNFKCLRYTSRMNFTIIPTRAN